MEAAADARPTEGAVGATEYARAHARSAFSSLLACASISPSALSGGFLIKLLKSYQEIKEIKACKGGFGDCLLSFISWIWRRNVSF